jgi:hypothetical protein
MKSSTSIAGYALRVEKDVARPHKRMRLYRQDQRYRARRRQGRSTGLRIAPHATRHRCTGAKYRRRQLKKKGIMMLCPQSVSAPQAPR